MEKFYGEFGGQFVPPAVLEALNQLEEAFLKYKDDEEFKKEYNYYLKQYVGRENPLYFAERLTNYAKGCKIYLKREDLNHTGAHKINNALGQILLAKRMGKKKVIAETGAGQHGVALATAAAFFGLECEIHMGEVDIKKQGNERYHDIPYLKSIPKILEDTKVQITYHSKLKNKRMGIQPKSHHFHIH